MKEFKINFGGDMLIVSAANNGVCKKWGQVRYEYIVTVKNGEKQLSFKFYDSVVNYEKGIKELDEQGLVDALMCALDDALSSDEYTLEEFLENFGYLDSGSLALQGIEAYKKCEVMKIGFDNLLSGDLYDWIDELRSYGE